MVMACPPVSYWLDGLFFAVFIGWLIAWGGIAKPPTPARRRVRLVTTAALTLLTVLLPVLELPWRRPPRLTGAKASHLVVIGDSISAGIFSDKPWPEVMQNRTGIRVKNLSKAGAETSDALAECRKLSIDDNLVLVEIGGNDLLGGVSGATFETNLEKLLAAVCIPGRTVVMFELPLLPHRIDYGRIQRRLAAQYHVQLIPKHYLTDVFAAGTNDGLHLSPAGAKHMANMITSMFNQLLAPPTPPATLPQNAH
jgi:acyl-CoA thioesterase-1